MNAYIFDEHGGDQELARMRLIEEALDSTSLGCLQRLGIGPGSRCLELGAGAGSIMRWMGNMVGRDGRVVGVDKNAAHLQDLVDAPYEVVEDEFLEASVGGHFDVAHCRYVLIHNRTGDEVLSQLGQHLKPGGSLVVEEPDFTSAMQPNANAPEALRRVNRAICRMFEQMHLDPGYGLTLPEKVATAGLRILSVVSCLHLAPGGSPVARLMAASTRALEDKSVETGEATRADIEQYVRGADDKRAWMTYYATISVIATKPV
jgi:SAM-dependent methyltransferase